MCLISYAYIRMLGAEGLTQATQIAILNANYIKERLEGAYPILYTGEMGRAAHEMIIDCREFKHAGVEVESDGIIPPQDFTDKLVAAVVLRKIFPEVGNQLGTCELALKRHIAVGPAPGEMICHGPGVVMIPGIEVT